MSKRKGNNCTSEPTDSAEQLLLQTNGKNPGGVRRNAYRQRNRSTSATEKSFKCEICGKSFDRKRNLSNHTLIHSVEKNYECFLSL